MPARLCFSFCADARAPGAAREALHSVDGLPEEHRAIGELLISELVTNAVLHAGMRSDEAIDVTIVAGPGLRVEVVDRGDGDPVAAAEDRDGGRGLLLVEQLSSRCGMQWSGGTRAWFELDPAPAAAGCPDRRSSAGPRRGEAAGGTRRGDGRRRRHGDEGAAGIPTWSGTA